MGNVISKVLHIHPWYLQGTDTLRFPRQRALSLINQAYTRLRKFSPMVSDPTAWSKLHITVQTYPLILTAATII